MRAKSGPRPGANTITGTPAFSAAGQNQSAEPYPFADMTPHLKRVFEAFGRERCYWGTDMTNSFAKCTYGQRVTHFTETLDFLTEEDKDWVMGRAILKRLNWA